jgi:sugar/nucleoside kinase (ribokinase family)
LSVITFFYLVGQDVKEFPVKKPLDIVDTNGAGDSFVGGMK